MDDLIRAAILGIVQGLTEFLPVSSSGHLILVPALFGWDDQGLAFDVGLHLGTLFALLVYFWRDWYVMFGTGLSDFRGHGFAFARHRAESRLLWLIALGSVPAAIVGLLFSDWIEENVRQPWVVAIGLVLAGIVLWLADRRGHHQRGILSAGVRDALLIGTAQACALIPGVSRSGATISAALFQGFARDGAARFAFLLGTPAFIGAAILQAGDLFSGEDGEFGMLAVGFAFSAAVGLAAIHYLLRYLRSNTMLPFVLYRFGVAALTLLIGGVRVL